MESKNVVNVEFTKFLRRHFFSTSHKVHHLSELIIEITITAIALNHFWKLTNRIDCVPKLLDSNNVRLVATSLVSLTYSTSWDRLGDVLCKRLPPSKRPIAAQVRAILCPAYNESWYSLINRARRSLSSGNYNLRYPFLSTRPWSLTLSLHRKANFAFRWTFWYNSNFLKSRTWGGEYSNQKSMNQHYFGRQLPFHLGGV
jgi:hypothetical protein